jgi:broad specificity phosphatase PhoE
MFYYISHPDVVIDPAVPVARWPLSRRGLQRMELLLEKPWVGGLKAVYCSTEQKAIDGAAVLTNHLDLAAQTWPDLGENDRTSTGYLPKEAFVAHAQRFFENPDTSIAGWETASAAQARIIAAVKQIYRGEGAGRDIAIVAHGGVGALLLTSLMARPISTEQEQPGSTGGNWFAFNAENWTLASGWVPIDGPAF